MTEQFSIDVFNSQNPIVEPGDDPRLVSYEALGQATNGDHEAFIDPKSSDETNQIVEQLNRTDQLQVGVAALGSLRARVVTKSYGLWGEPAKTSKQLAAELGKKDFEVDVLRAHAKKQLAGNHAVRSLQSSADEKFSPTSGVMTRAQSADRAHTKLAKVPRVSHAPVEYRVLTHTKDRTPEESVAYLQHQAALFKAFSRTGHYKAMDRELISSLVAKFETRAEVLQEEIHSTQPHSELRKVREAEYYQVLSEKMVLKGILKGRRMSHTSNNVLVQSHRYIQDAIEEYRTRQRKARLDAAEARRAKA